MQADLEALRISDREIERFSGLEVSDLLIGGLFGGVFRLPISKTRQRSRSFIFTELVVGGLVYILSIPVGLAVIRDASNQNHPSVVLGFLAATLGVTFLALCGWHIYLWKASPSLKPLMHLLDEIDRFHRVLESVSLMDELQSVQRHSGQNESRDRVLRILQSTRDSLVAGLMAEKIIRRSGNESRGRSGDLITHIDENLAMLSSIEINHRLQEYSNVLQESLDIGLRVQGEIQQISSSSPEELR